MILFLLLVAGLFLWAVASLFRPQTSSTPKDFRAVTQRYPHLPFFGGLDLPARMWKEFHDGGMAEGARRRHERLGRTFYTTYLGSACLHTIDPDNIRTVTTAHFDSWGKSSWVREAAKHVGHGVLLNDGAAWKKSRTLLKPIFARLPDTSAFVEPHLQRLVAAVETKRGAAFDFQRLAEEFVLDVSTELLFGRSTDILAEHKGGPHDANAHRFLALVKEFESPAALFMSVGALSWLELLPSYGRLLRCVAGIKAFFRRELDLMTSLDRRSYHAAPAPNTTSTSPGVFRELRAEGVPVDEIQGELQNIFFASFDTTSALLANLVEALARHPDVQQRVRDEMAEVLGGRAATNHDVEKKMVYLRNVVRETLRLYSPVTAHTRRAIRDTILPRGGGVDGSRPMFVPAGTTIIWSSYALNRDPEHYGPDWAEFRPGRWAEITDRRPHYYMPFGTGPRTCMGKKLVKTEVSLVVVRMLQAFSELRSEASDEFREAKAVSFYNAHGTVISARE